MTCGVRVGVSRRHVLYVGGLGLTGITLSRLLAAEAEHTRIRPRADACVLIFLNGGPSHLDMWDMKPQQTEQIRGEFQPIATSLAGYQMCELLPRLAKQMHLATVVRSVHHSVNDSHAGAVYTAMTGHDRGDQPEDSLLGASPDDNPTPGSVLSLLRPSEKLIVANVHMPYVTREGKKGPPQPGFFGGYLGHAADPLFVLDDPNAPDFHIRDLTLLPDVSEERLATRRALFEQLDRYGRMAGGSPSAQPQAHAALEAMDGFQRRALELLTSKSTQQAFRLSDEPDSVRESYGRNIYGQSVLLARRLIEAGTRMVTISWAPDANATWDTHTRNFKLLRNPLLPQFDAACSSLVADLQDRGMLGRTLVAVLGDFGRTPKVNQNAGRDHWNHCYSLMFVGGGMKPGFNFGSSDQLGAFPASDALHAGDVIATMYHALGIRHDQEIRDRLGRPHRLVPHGEVVHDLLV